MLKKTIRYTDYNDNDVVEDFYFNLTKVELIELEVGSQGGLAETLKAIVAEGDNLKIIENFKKIILMAYGEKSEDGKRFIKSKELSDGFAQTDAYSELFIELATQTDSAIEFIKGVVPPGLVSQAELEATVEPIETVELLTTKDPKDMTREELLRAFSQKTQE